MKFISHRGNIESIDKFYENTYKCNIGNRIKNYIELITNIQSEYVTSLDDNDSSLCYDEDTFDLYIDIARNCHNAVPIEVMARKEFERFKISKNKIPKGQYVFKY